MTVENEHHLMTGIAHMDSLSSYYCPLVCTAQRFLSHSRLHAHRSKLLWKNHLKLTCLTTNGGFLSPGSLKLFPKCSWVGWCRKRRLGEDGEVTRDCVPLENRSGLFSLGFVFLLFVGALCPRDFDKSLCNLHFSSWKWKTNKQKFVASFC